MFKILADVSGESVSVPVTRVRGSPIALKHTIATHLHRIGIPEAQIDTAAGHDGMGTNKKNYMHVRPEYLTDFCRGIEAFWREVSKHTKVHLLPHSYPKLTIEEAKRLRDK